MRRMKDLTGQVFGEWTVLYKSDKTTSSGAIVWHCRCSCGNERDVVGTDLRAGRTTKCKQHYTKFQSSNPKSSKTTPSRKRCNFSNDKIGMRFGKLTVLEKIEVRKDGTYIKCRCDCGSTVSVRWGNLTSGAIQSCGCIKSIGEEKISSILVENNISFKKEYSFPDLKGDNGGLLRFDFAILEKNELIRLIEYQGAFHYINPPKGWTDVRDSDKAKEEYCKKNNIDLLVIPYWDIDKIDIQYLLNTEGEIL